MNNLRHKIVEMLGQQETQPLERGKGGRKIKRKDKKLIEFGGKILNKSKLIKLRVI